MGIYMENDFQMSNYEDTYMDYFTSETDVIEAEVAPKTTAKSPPKPALPPMPVNAVVFQVQLFSNAEETQGRSKYAIKIEAYYGGADEINTYAPDWYRIVQLYKDTKTMQSWVRNKQAEGFINAAEAADYQASINAVNQNVANPLVEWSRMGHICDRNNGYTYYPGQFVVATMHLSGRFEVTIYGGHVNVVMQSWSLDKWIITKRKQAARHAARRGFIDPFNVLRRQYEERMKLRQRMGL